MTKVKTRLPQAGDVYTQENEYTHEQEFHIIEVRGVKAIKRYGPDRPYRVRFLRFWKRDAPGLRTEYWQLDDFKQWELKL